MGTAFPGAICVLLLVIHSACAVDPKTVDDTVLSADYLLELNKELYEVIKWKDLGIELGLQIHLLDEIDLKSRGDIKSARRDMIEAWLLQKGCVDKPSWRALVEALMTRPVGREDVASDIAKHHKKGGKVTKRHMCDDHKALLDKVNSKGFVLDKAPTKDMVNYLSQHNGFISYYNLGLALGMKGSSLSVIAADYPRYDRRIIEVLDQWIRGGHRINSEKDTPTSWRRLVEALLSPIVDERILAEKIAAEHPKK